MIVKLRFPVFDMCAAGRHETCRIRNKIEKEEGDE